MKRILFVCTGNTCRSPMAEAVFNARAPMGFKAFSVGITASEGRPVSENTVKVLNEMGITTNHSSTPLDEKLMREYDFIVGITSDHARIIMQMFPEYSDKIFAFPSDVNDPYGSSVDIYRKCRELICAGVDKIIEGICYDK